MSKWKDDTGNLTDVLCEFYAGKSVVPTCCVNPDVHTYFHKFNPSSTRGSAWSWCSNCKSFVHLDGFQANKNIPNCSTVDTSKLCAVPEYLDSIKSIIDTHNKSINI